MTLTALTQEHHAPLLAACWRELKTLDVRSPKIIGVFGVEDFEHPANVCGMLEVECYANGKLVQLTGGRMIPLVHGYHESGPNGAADGTRPAYLIGSSSKGVGMPNLSLIRLPPPSLDTPLLRLVVSHPTVLASIFGMCALVAVVSSNALSGAAREVLPTALLVGHLAEGLFAMYVCLAEFKIPLRESFAWAGMITVIGIASTRFLLRLRHPANHAHDA